MSHCYFLVLRTGLSSWGCVTFAHFYLSGTQKFINKKVERVSGDPGGFRCPVNTETVKLVHSTIGIPSLFQRYGLYPKTVFL